MKGEAVSTLIVKRVKLKTSPCILPQRVKSLRYVEKQGDLLAHNPEDATGSSQDQENSENLCQRTDAELIRSNEENTGTMHTNTEFARGFPGTSESY